MLITFSFIITAFLLALSLTYYLSRPSAVLYIIDTPNERSLHTQPTPRSGGLGILFSLLVLIPSSYFVYNINAPVFHWIALSVLIIAIISFVDDCMDVSALYRFVLHFIAAAILLIQADLWIIELSIASYTVSLPFIIAVPVSLLFIVWMVNLYNFMDGMDGFSGGMSVIGFASFALIGAWQQQFEFMLFNALIASASLGFLWCNFPPARIFMGDAGASSLGFLAAGMSLWAQKLEIIPLWLSLLLFSPFIIDATVTLLRRLLQGEKIWQAHRSHYYQRLVQLGWGHKKTVLVEYVLMLVCSLSTLFILQLPTALHWQMGVLWIMTYIFFIYAVNYLEAKSEEIS